MIGRGHYKLLATLAAIWWVGGFLAMPGSVLLVFWVASGLGGFALFAGTLRQFRSDDFA